MKVKELRNICDGLSRFATTREKASGPESLIGVQLSNDTLKLIAGTSTAGVVATVGEFEGPSGRVAFTIPARPFLQAAKALPAKQDISIRIDTDRLSIASAMGGTVDIGATGLSIREAGFAPKPKTKRVIGDPIDAANLKRMAKLFKAIAAKVEVPSVQIIDGTCYATAVAPGNRPMYASFRFTGRSSIERDEYNMAGYRNFWEALTHFTEDGIMSWDKGGVMVTSDNMEVFSAPYLVSKYTPETGAEPPRETEAWPILVASEKSDVAVTLPRKTLTEIVKGQAPYDEHNRVTLEVDTDSLRVSPFGSRDGMDAPATTEGKGIRSVTADYLTALLNAMDSKEVTLRWSGGVPAVSLSSEDYSSWTILLAPVTI